MRRGIAYLEPDGVLDELATEVIGAALEVHKIIGPGYLENVYEEALCRELSLRELSYVRQPEFTLNYKGVPIGKGRIDLLVADQLVVELKAADALATLHSAQVISYLRALHLKLGLIINFNVPLLKHGIKRVILS